MLSRNTPAAAMLFVAMLLAASFARSAEQSQARVLEQARQELNQVRKSVVGVRDDAGLLELRGRVLAVQAKVQDASASLQPRAAEVRARIAELGPTPQNTDEPSDVASRRSELEQQLASVEGEAKLAALLSLEGDQIMSQIAERSRQLFRARLGDRTLSPLERPFWTRLSADARNDVRHTLDLAAGITAALRTSSPALCAGALAVSALALFARRRLARLLHDLPVKTARLRHALGACGQIALWTAAAAVVSMALLLAIGSGERPAPHLAEFLGGAARTITFGVYVVALGVALSSVRAPAARLPAIPDAIAVILRAFSVQIAIVIVLAALIEELAAAANLSLGASVALEILSTLALGATLARGLRRIVQAHIATKRLPVWVAIAAATGWIAIVGAAISAIAGYVALGSLIVREVTWALVVAASAYLLAVLVDGILAAAVPPRRLEGRLEEGAARETRTLGGVLLLALARFAIGLAALALLLAPYAPGAIDLLPQLHRMQQGIEIGAIRLRPDAVIRGVVTLVIGLAFVRILKQWIAKRYLPATRMDPGMRESVTSLTGYVGYVIIFSVALSATGVGVEQIAWVASALALGIGFGLQTIVQNFVSGLILLAERPVKVGDWVVLEHIEGDIRRIRARATEIQSIDRSTVIVPNSELITKVVRNVTFANPLGRVEIRLPVPLGTDVQRVRDELLLAFRGHPEILEAPAPNVMLDGVEGGDVFFDAAGYVSSPRAVHRVQSAVLFDALIRLNEANISMLRPTPVVMRSGMPRTGDDARCP